MSELLFSELRESNRIRNAACFPQCDTWSLSDWGCALAGEVGEACNFIKKQLCDGRPRKEDIAKELADVVVYADLIATKLGIRLEDAVREKFNEVSSRVNSDIRL